MSEQATLRMSNGTLTWLRGRWRVQGYWPEGYVKRGDVFVKFPTSIRVMWRAENRGFGFQVFGFGFGADWSRDVQ